MIHYEAICLGEIVGNNTWLMIDLAGFKLTTLRSLVRDLANNIKTGETDVSVATGNDKTYRIDFCNIVYNVQSNQVEYKDGVDAYRHYKIKYLTNGRFQFDRKELMVLGKIANKFVLFSPGYSEKYLNIQLTDDIIDKMFLGFVNIQAQAGCIITLDEDVCIALNKQLKYKYLNARVSMPSDRKPYLRSAAHGFPQLLKEVSDDRKKIGNLRDIAIYMLRVAISASETTKILDTRNIEEKNILKSKLCKIGNMLSDIKIAQSIDNINEVYTEIVRLFNSNTEDNIFNINSVDNIFKKSEQNVLERERLKKEQELRQLESIQPITDLNKFSETYIDGIRSGFTTHSFRTKRCALLIDTEIRRVYELLEVKNRQEFKVTVDIIKTNIDSNPFNVKVESVLDDELIDRVEYTFDKEQTTKYDIRHRGLVNVSPLGTKMHNRIYWNR